MGKQNEDKNTHITCNKVEQNRHFQQKICKNDNSHKSRLQGIGG